jgi:NADPH:quinone reductase
MSIPTRMSRIEYASPGPPEALQWVEAAVPQPRALEVLVRVQAAGVNRPDVLQRQGRYRLPPNASAILGLEIAGEIVAVGPQVQDRKPGDRVCALTNGGGYAQYCAVPVGQALRWPISYDAVRAAALPETFFTVWANLFHMAALRSGESALIHGGSSGIGTTAIQLAREFGARVFTTVGSAEKAAACIALGAELAINYREQAFEAVLAERTEGRGVDVILDMVGASYFERNLGALAQDGRLAIIGSMGGSIVEKFNLGDLMQRRASIMGSMMRSRTSAEKAALARELEARVWPILDAGRCAPLIHAVLPMAQAAQAHRLMESSDHIGKIVLRLD